MTVSRLLLFLAFWLASLGAVGAGPPRIATVDADRLFTNYYRTKTEKAKLAEAQRALDVDPRKAVMARIRKELRELETEIRNEDHSEEMRQEYYRQWELKSHELRASLRDFHDHREAQQKAINEQLVKISKVLLVEIQSTVQLIAANEGYDMVLEIGGETSSQLPTLLYIRDAADITDRVLQALNRTKPAPLPAGVTPAPPMPAPPLPPVPNPPQPPPPAPTEISSPPVPRAVPAEEDA